MQFPPLARRAPLLAAAFALSCSGPTQNGPAVDRTNGSVQAAPPAPAAPEALATGRLPDLARPLGYRVALNVDPRREDFSGTVRIDLEIARPTRGLVLHARGLRIASARLIPGEASREEAPAAGIAATTTMRAAAGGIGEPEELVLAFDRDVPVGRAHLVLSYAGDFNHALRGLYRVRVDDAWYAFTDSEPTDARRIFPSFDEPSAKVPWELSLTVPDGQVAVANMPEVSRSPVDDAHMVTVGFAPTPPTSSYLVAFAVGPFDVAPLGTGALPVRVIAVHGQGNLARTALETASAEVQILGDYFGRPYPYPKLDLVAVPEFAPGAMENPGLITFRDDLLLLDPEHATTRTRRALAAVAAHELAHQWFGDLVTMAWWDDVWLNEAFATWMQSKVVDRWQPGFGASIDALRSRGAAMETDALTSARAVRQPVTSTSQAMEAFDGITYEKGAAVLSMLESWVGEENFRTGIRTYLHDHEWGNATARDLFDALSHAGNRDVGAVAATFLDQSGVPLISAELDCTAGATPSLRVTQSRYRVPRATDPTPEGGPGESRWQIPVCVRFPMNDTTVRTCTLLAEPTGTIPLQGLTSCPAWVHPNADEAGYYRYTMPPAVRALVGRERLATLDVRTRLGLLDDAWALVRGGQMPVDQFITVLDGYRADRARPVVEEIIAIFGALYDQVADPASRPTLSHWMAGYLVPIARELGWDPQPNDDDDRRLVRRAVISMLGMRADDADTLAEAERRTQAWLHDPHSVNADVAALAVPMASRHAGQERLDALLAALAHAPTPGDRSILVSGISSFDNPDVLRHALDATLTDAIRMADTARVIFGATSSPVRRPVAIAWMQEHFDALHHRLEGDELGYFALTLGNACTPQEVASETAFWQPRVGEFQGGERHMREAVERAEECSAMRARESQRLNAYLAHPPSASGGPEDGTHPARPHGQGHGHAPTPAHGAPAHGGAARPSAQHRKPIS